MRWAVKRDANEPVLIGLAQGLGAQWEFGPPLDGWVCFRRQWTPVEIKNPDGRNRYTDSQVLFLARCKERQAPVWTWRDEADVLASLGAKIGA